MEKQKILLVHNYYQIPGGEDTVVANEKQLLEENGHQVILYTRHNSELKEFNILQKLLLPLNTVFSLRTYREVKQIIRRERIDIVHVHNTLNLISPSVYYAALACKVPVVQTIHNFRMLCPGASFFRNGEICEDCLHKGLICSLKHNCYRDSKIQTLACVINMLFHRMMGIYGKIHYICLTEFNKKKLLTISQIKESQIDIKPNFTQTEVLQPEKTEEKQKYIFVGRLEKLKGVDILLESWKLLGKDAPELILCGTGPLDDWCKEFVAENHLNVQMKGFLLNAEVKQQMRQSSGLIMPTQCYEAFGLTILEAYSVGTPALVGDMGNAGALVEDGITGVKYIYNDPKSLAEAVKRFSQMDRKAMGENAYSLVGKRYSREKNYEILSEIYDRLT